MENIGLNVEYISRIKTSINYSNFLHQYV